jgi:uncharacterized surface protein with fasciclin (FAS1) repeats
MNKTAKDMKRSKWLLVGVVMSLVTSMMMTSCYDSDDIGGNLYTFKNQNIGEFLKQNTDEYSEFTKLLDTTGVLGLLEAYGAYTCFAPDNMAMRLYYAKHSKSRLADFDLPLLKEIAYDHLIKGDTIYSRDFNVGNRLVPLSMSERYFIVTQENVAVNDTLYLNNSPIKQRDIKLHNGVVHKLGRVIEPVRLGIVEVISNDSKFTLFHEALVATGVADLMLKEKDDTYDPTPFNNKTNGSWEVVGHKTMYVPQTRRYGYTVFMESDETLAKYGITDLASMAAKAAEIYDEMYPQDANITDIRDRRNSLNRFVAYHVLSRELDRTKLIDAYDSPHMLKTVDMFEYFETMCPNTLIEVSKIRALGTAGSNLLNRDPMTGDAIRITDYFNKQASNGIYHEVDKLLVYDTKVEGMLSSKRLRFNAAGFFDEFANNNMRGLGMTTYASTNLGFYLPKGYLERLSCSDQTTVTYLTCFEGYLDYQGDEIWLVASSGKLYDFTLTTPPVPAGTYEVRFGYQPTIFRGVAQIYFDGQPAGLPVNFGNLANNPVIGFEVPGTVREDINGFQNDKMMRNRGYMKGPAGFTVPNTTWYTGPARSSVNYLRKIVGTFHFDEASTHTITIKGLSNGEFMFDFIEYVPTSVLENEDIY